ncbi:MAG: hypothetical protein CL792_03685 [Chloroflexi bacterium]|nr:hypothetical protein [Chloroflexota bacterium]|tara:strand:+ start:7417 stop:7764 length:348 start_codon:yes stop_codon:yes gene_type:complete
MKKSKKNLFSSRIKKLSENVRKNAKNFTEQDSEYSQYSDALKDATKKISPRLKRAAKKTEDYIKTHEEEINENAQKGGKFIAQQALRMATPPVLRPAIDAMKEELGKKKRSNSKD